MIIATSHDFFDTLLSDCCCQPHMNNSIIIWIKLFTVYIFITNIFIHLTFN